LLLLVYVEKKLIKTSPLTPLLKGEGEKTSSLRVSLPSPFGRGAGG